MPPFIARKRHRDSSPQNATPSKKGQKPATVFDAVDSPASSSNVQAEKDFLDSLANSGESSLSDAGSSEFEDVLPAKKQKISHQDSDEEMDWEDALPAETPVSAAPMPTGDLELTLGGGDQEGRSLTSQKKGPSKIERQIRMTTHCVHVQFLMFHNAIKNAWICDKEVQRILVDQLSPQMRKSLGDWRRDCGSSLKQGTDSRDRDAGARATKRRKGKNQFNPRSQRDWGPLAERQESGAPNFSRGDPTVRLLNLLASYWRKRFGVTAPGLRKQGYKDVRHLEEDVRSFQSEKHDPLKHGERVEGLRQFRNLAKRSEGSRDVGAQLFVGLLRGLGIEARLVASLQPAGFSWSKSEEASSRKKSLAETSSAPTKAADDDSDGEESIVEDNAKNGVARVPHSKTRHKPNHRTLGLRDNPIELSDTSELSDALSIDITSDASSVDATPKNTKKVLRAVYDKDLLFPSYWAEVISPITHEVIPVDPIVLVPSVVTTPEQLSSFEPRGARSEKAKQVLAYVIAHSSDGTAKDVTTRYLKLHMWPGKTKGVRMPPEKVPILNRYGKVKRYEEHDWFKRLMSSYTRHERLRSIADDIEDAKELRPVKVERKAAVEGEETLQGYKQSADFVLERHLRREEALVPGAKPVKTFTTGKGDSAKEEPVYRRKDVVTCKTEESWHKEGRQPKMDAYAHPLKRVPIRAVTLTRKREVEEATRQMNGEKPTQGLYSKDQTEYITPPPIENGIIPKNKYGNIDCFVPSMVPKGAVHVPLRSTVRICKKLGIDYAEAVTGFEFGNKLAVPVVNGVVVACENEDALIDAWEEEEAVRQAKEDEKRNKLILSTWRKFLMGLRIVERVREEYGDDPTITVQEINPFTNRNKPTKPEGMAALHLTHEGSESNMEGGFIHDDESFDEPMSPRQELTTEDPVLLDPMHEERSDETLEPAGPGKINDAQEDSESAYEESKHFKKRNNTGQKRGNAGGRSRRGDGVKSAEPTRRSSRLRTS